MPTQPPQDTDTDTGQAFLNYLTSTLSSLLTTATTSYTAFILPLLPPPIQSLSLTISSILSPIVLSSKNNADGTANVDIVALASLLLILYLSLRTLDFLRRSIFAWVRFFVRVGVLLVVVQAGLYVQANGWEKSVRDAGWVGGLVWGWAEEVVGGGGGQAMNGYGYSYGGGAGRGMGRRGSGSGSGKGWLNTSGGGGRGQMKYGGGGGGTRRRGGCS